ncbi:hypothetical protein C8R47DRAFT_1247099 [Mycena vitilis]|nr:hypothetical protein C8R47DRAFT_1247099 [Mycena vitilis]
MSNAAPNSTNIASPSTPVQPAYHKLRFPPFPQVPEGVTIVPFKSFTERGIQLFRTEDEDGDGDGFEKERDGLGIPTVALRAKHRLLPAMGSWDWADSGDPEDGEEMRNHAPSNVGVAAVDRLLENSSISAIEDFLQACAVPLGLGICSTARLAQLPGRHFGACGGRRARLDGPAVLKEDVPDVANADAASESAPQEGNVAFIKSPSFYCPDADTALGTVYVPFGVRAPGKRGRPSLGRRVAVFQTHDTLTSIAPTRSTRSDARRDGTHTPSLRARIAPRFVGLMALSVAHTPASSSYPCGGVRCVTHILALPPTRTPALVDSTTLSLTHTLATYPYWPPRTVERIFRVVLRRGRTGSCPVHLRPARARFPRFLYIDTAARTSNHAAIVEYARKAILHRAGPGRPRITSARSLTPVWKKPQEDALLADAERLSEPLTPATAPPRSAASLVLQRAQRQPLLPIPPRHPHPHLRRGGGEGVWGWAGRGCSSRGWRAWRLSVLQRGGMLAWCVGKAGRRCSASCSSPRAGA